MTSTRPIHLINLIFTTLACAGGPIYAQDSAGKKPLSVDAFFELRSVVDPQISPDGKHILYGLATPDRAADKRFTNLWIANTDGGDVALVTDGDGGFTRRSPAVNTAVPLRFGHLWQGAGASAPLLDPGSPCASVRPACDRRTNTSPRAGAAPCVR